MTKKKKKLKNHYFHFLSKVFFYFLNDHFELSLTRIPYVFHVLFLNNCSFKVEYLAKSEYNSTINLFQRISSLANKNMNISC